ncbi:hypothetical protein E6C27_scaffold181G00480 [Cucumis melo var. makuwa]|uniref:Uncharacterized protein n=1 Tax=Cucumis melo var. makuwa TaxID=1194695 RepID=A0A5A7UIF7_CUCMM|nr:hypothetical protein E6C27_scaffold181G00480 [Cucumis melo var. makuwa]
MLQRSAYQGIEREELELELVRVKSRKRGGGALRSTAQMVPYEVSISLILIVRLVSAFGSAKAIAWMFSKPNPGSLSDQGSGHKGPSTIQGQAISMKPGASKWKCFDILRSLREDKARNSWSSLALLQIQRIRTLSLSVERYLSIGHSNTQGYKPRQQVLSIRRCRLFSFRGSPRQKKERVVDERGKHLEKKEQERYEGARVSCRTYSDNRKTEYKDSTLKSDLIISERERQGKELQRAKRIDFKKKKASNELRGLIIKREDEQRIYNKARLKDEDKLVQTVRNPFIFKVRSSSTKKDRRSTKNLWNESEVLILI